MKRRSGHLRLVPVVGLFAATVVAGSTALATTITQNTSWTIDRAGTTAKYRVTAYGDSIYAGYRGSLSSVAKRAAPWVDGEYSEQGVERRHRGDPPHQVGRAAPPTSTTTRSSRSARTCRRPTPASSPSRCAATTACRRARASPARAAPATSAPLDTALATAPTYLQLAMQYDQRQYAHRDVRLSRWSRTSTTRATRPTTSLTQLHRSGVRPGGEQAGQASCRTSPASNWRACNFAAHLRLPVRRQLRAVHGRRLRLERRRADRLRRAPLRPGRDRRRPTSTPHHRRPCRSTLRDANTPLRRAPSTSYDYIQSDNTHPTYTGSTVYVGLFGGTGSGSGRPTTATRRSSAARTRCGTASVTSGWGGRCRSTTCRLPNRHPRMRLERARAPRLGVRV